MTRGHLSSRSGTPGDRHHLWNNNGTWWVHYTLHFRHRKRRIRRSLKTRSLEEAIRRRDELFASIARDGEWIEERGDGGGRMLVLPSVSIFAAAGCVRRPLLASTLFARAV
jgi:hypothetical protein